MAITNYSELKSAIADWLDRTDLTDQIPDFITLAEARHKRDFKLRRMETRVTADTIADTEYYTLPDNYVAMRNIQLNTDPKTSLEYLTPEQMDRIYAGSNKGKPIAYWEDQKIKCREGVIYKHNGLTWYLTRDYYMWLNFLPIYDKEEKKYGFARS